VQWRHGALVDLPSTLSSLRAAAARYSRRRALERAAALTSGIRIARQQPPAVIARLLAGLFSSQVRERPRRSDAAAQVRVETLALPRARAEG